MKSPLVAGLSGLLFVSSTVSHTVLADDPLTIVVTASRSAETVDEALVPVSVIGRKEIERSGASSVYEVLNRVPGLVVTNNGGAGKSSSVFLRGTESDHVLVMIDGVKVGSASLGTTPFQNIPLSIVEKIEVVRGPRSSLYGSEAIGGVIQIFTRRGGDGQRTNFSVSAGSNSTTDLTAGISGGNETGWYSAQVSNYSTDGINACRGDFNAGCFTVEPDDDGYDNTSVNLRGGAQFASNASIEGGLTRSDGETEFDGGFQNEADSVTQAAHIKLNISPTQSWNTSLLVANAKDESENFLNGIFASSFDTNRDQLNWLNEIQLGSGRIVAGIDYVDDEVDSNTPFEVSSRDNTGYYASYNTSMGLNDWEVSVRSDDNEQFGSETTGGVAIGRDLNSGLRVTGSVGTAFKAPTFNELYFPGFGNPNLEAETSTSFDLGVAGKNWAVNVFQTEVENLIGFDSVTFLPVNIEEAEIFGIELSSQAELAGWFVNTALTLQDPENAGSGPNQGNQLARRAKTLLSISADRPFGNWNVGGVVRYTGSRFDDLANNTELDSYTLVDIHAEYRFKPQWEIGLRVNNLFDEEYETAAFFNQDGINGLITLRYVSR